MNKDNKNKELDNTDKKLHISDVMKRISELENEYVNLPKDKIWDEDGRKKRKEEIEFIFDELNLELPYY